MKRSSTESKDKAHNKRKQSQQGRVNAPAASGAHEASTAPRAAHPEKTQAAQEQRPVAPSSGKAPAQQQQQQQTQPEQTATQQLQGTTQQQALPAAKVAQLAVQMPSFRMVINRPQAIVIDLLGVLVCRSFMSSSREFREFFQHNVLEYLNDNWKQKQLKIMINFFRCSQQNVPDEYRLADREESRDDQIRQAKKHVVWKLRNDPTNSALSLFMLGITEWGYKNKILRTAIYDDVPYILKYWKDQLKIPVYVGVGSADFLVMVLSNSIHGDLLPYFNGHMNIMDFDGMRANKDFRKLANLLRLAPEKILYLTRFRLDCRRAMETGMQSLIVLRSDFDSHSLVKELKAKRASTPMADGTRLRVQPDETASPPSGRNLADLKNADLKNQMEKNISTLSLIDDHEDNSHNNLSSQIVEQDLTKYNIILSLSEIAFK